MDRKIIEQRVDGNPVMHSPRLADADQAQRRLAQRSRPRIAAQQQPCPFELVSWLDDTAGQSGRRLPIGRKDLAHGATVSAQQSREREAGEILRPDGPVRVIANLGPGEAGLQQMHVRIRFEIFRTRPPRAKCARASAIAETIVDQRTQPQRQPFEFVEDRARPQRPRTRARQMPGRRAAPARRGTDPSAATSVRNKPSARR